jgi:hypothetical protein
VVSTLGRSVAAQSVKGTLEMEKLATRIQGSKAFKSSEFKIFKHIQDGTNPENWTKMTFLWKTQVAMILFSVDAG